MRVLEREERHLGPVRNAQRIATPVLWLMTPASLLLSGMLWLQFAGDWTPARAVACGALSLASLCLVLSLVSQRLFWWAPRLLAALIAGACIAAVYLAAWFPIPARSDPRLPAIFIATLGFLLLGLPCLCFTLWGHTGGKLARGDTERITPMDRWTARLLVVLHYAMLLALAFYIAHTLALLLMDSLR